MGNAIKSLTEIFNHRQFRIPDFQRGYSWQKPQLEDFWQDICNLEDEGTHYAGVLTIDEVKKSDPLWQITNSQNPRLLDTGSYKLFSIIDGQQRITTAIILIASILKNIEDQEYILDKTKADWTSVFLHKSIGKSEPTYIFGYDADPSSFEFLKTRIFRQKSKLSENVPRDTLYTSNLKAAQKFFSKKLKPMTSDATAVVFQKLVHRLKFNEFEVSQELDIHVTFETMNNRGKPLSTLELLKNRLIYISSKLPDDKQDKTALRTEIHNCWRTVYTRLGANKKQTLDDDEFLTAHRNIFFPPDKSNKVSTKEYLLDRTFTTARIYSNETSIESIRAYIFSLQEASTYWYEIKFPEESELPEVVKHWIFKIKRLGFKNLSSILLAGIFKFRDEKCSASDLEGLTKIIERYIFLLFYVSQLRSNAGKNERLKYAYDLYHNNQKTAVLDVTEMMRIYIYGPEDDWGWLDLERFSKKLSELFTRRKGYYSWNGLKYFLYEYEKHLEDSDGPKIHWDAIQKNGDKSIEHICPQTRTKKCWVKALSGIKEENQKMLIHDLGNLVLIPSTKNSALKDHCFSRKKSHTNKKGVETGFFKGTHSEIQVSRYEQWTPKEIHERGLKMLEFFIDNWQIDEEQIEYLHGKKLSGLLFPKVVAKKKKA